MENTKNQAEPDNSEELEDLSHQTNSKPTLKEEFSTFKKYFKAIFNRDTLHLMIAHHPNCEVFDEHVFKIGKLRLCRGCFLSYPPLYALLIITAVWPASREFFVYQGLWIDNLWWFVISFGIFSLIGRLLGRYSLFIKD